MNKLIFLLAIQSLNCSHLKVKNIKVDMKCDRIQYEVLYSDKSNDIDKNTTIIFRTAFKNNIASIFNKDSLIFEDSILTDHRIGIASKVNVVKSNHLKLSIDKCSLVELGNLEEYNYIYVNLNTDNLCTIEKTGKKKMFK